MSSTSEPAWSSNFMTEYHVRYGDHVLLDELIVGLMHLLCTPPPPREWVKFVDGAPVYLREPTAERLAVSLVRAMRSSADPPAAILGWLRSEGFDEDQIGSILRAAEG